MPANTVIKNAQDQMTKAVEHAIHEFAAVRSGKASPNLIENVDVFVQSYGSKMKLKQLANISAPEPRLLRIEPFDPSTLRDIERSIQESKLGFNPSIEGKVIRLPIPELSLERRQQMVKTIKQMGEEARVRVRSARRDGLESLKKLEKGGEVSEDDIRRHEKEIQSTTDKKIIEIDQHLAAKEKELLTM